MTWSVWFGEGITLLSLLACLCSWALVARGHVRPWPVPQRRTRFLRLATPWTWAVTGCFLVTFAIQVLKWRGV